MNHHDDVGAGLERRPVAGLLVAPVAPVDLVAERSQSELIGCRDRVIAAGVVDQDHLIDDLAVELADGAPERRFGVVRREHYDNSLASEHSAMIIRALLPGSPLGPVP